MIISRFVSIFYKQRIGRVFVDYDCPDLHRIPMIRSYDNLGDQSYMLLDNNYTKIQNIGVIAENHKSDFLVELGLTIYDC